MDFTEVLITFIQEHPCLYDFRDKDYKDTELKNQLWEQICKELNQSRETIKCKWKNLKDGYCKYKKTLNVPYTPGQKQAYENWIWGPYLSFLDGAIRSRRAVEDQPTCTVPTIPEHGSDDSVEILSGTEDTRASFTEINTSVEESQPLHNSPASTSRAFKRKQSNDEDHPVMKKQSSKDQTHLVKSKQSNDQDNPVNKQQSSKDQTHLDKRKQSSNQDNFVKSVLGYIENKKKKDSIDLLFASYATSLKSMKPATQATVKVKLAKIFAEAEVQDSLTLRKKEDPVSEMYPLHSMLRKVSNNDSEETEEDDDDDPTENVP